LLWKKGDRLFDRSGDRFLIIIEKKGRSLISGYGKKSDRIKIVMGKKGDRLFDRRSDRIYCFRKRRRRSLLVCQD